jgi:hypothetical protein
MRRFLTALVFVSLAAPAWAQQVKIVFHDGQVSVDSNGAAPRTILAEWSRIGGTNIVNGERVTGAPLTLKLVDVPESQALEIILKSAAGYVAAPRGRTPGASHYDRILVLATSTTQFAAAPGVRPAPGNAPFNQPGAQRFVPRPAPMPVEEVPEVEEPAEQQPQAEPVFSFPQTAQPNNYRAVPVQPVQFPTGADAPGMSNSPTFGVVGAPVPGMIQQLPQPQQQPATPGRPTRPPGQ